MIDGDFAATADYAQLIGDFRARRKSAQQVAEALLERGEAYHALVFLLIAGDDADEKESERAYEKLDLLRTAEMICAEDDDLAELQLALWYHHGHVVPRDDALAAEHVRHAAVPFIELPSLEEIQAAGDIPAFVARAQSEGLERYGVPEGADRRAVADVLAKIFADAGWPPDLDVTLPLGPSMPYRPHNLHHRHTGE